MRATSISSAALAVAVSASIVLTGASAASARPDAAPIPPASGHAQVIAQGVVSFTAGAHHWRLVTNDVGSGAGRHRHRIADVPRRRQHGLDAGPIRITEPDGLGWLLADGEATFRPAGSAVAIDPTPGALVHEIAIDEGSGDDAFDPGNGLRDLDLVRDVLATGESITVRSEVSALIFVTTGIATAADGSEIPTGATRAIVGETTLTNGGDAPAVVLAVIIGTPVDAATGTTSAPGGDGPTPTQPPATPAPTAPPTTIDPTLETDGDGLTDVEEIDIYGTNPNNYDTDGDTVSDYLEAKNGYSDPFNPDTDGDGYDDSEQFDGYDPLDPNSYPGAPSATSPPPPFLRPVANRPVGAGTRRGRGRSVSGVSDVNDGSRESIVPLRWLMAGQFASPLGGPYDQTTRIVASPNARVIGTHPFGALSRRVPPTFGADIRACRLTDRNLAKGVGSGGAELSQDGDTDRVRARDGSEPRCLRSSVSRT